MSERASPADNARILQSIATEKEVVALIDLVLDQSLPRDIRKSAGDRLNDLEGATLGFIRHAANRSMLANLMRCGFVQAKFQAFAKGGYDAINKPTPIAPMIESGDTDAKLKLIAALEAQNALLRQLATKKQGALQLHNHGAAPLPF